MDAIRDIREQESSSWQHRVSTLVSENDDLAAEMKRNVSQLKDKLSTAEDNRDHDSSAEANERHLLYERIRDTVMQVTSMNAMLMEARGTAHSLENGHLVHDAEKQRLDEEMMALRTQIRESDEALDKAVANNEQLRKQMEGQRKEAQDECDKELQDCQDRYEAQLASLAST